MEDHRAKTQKSPASRLWKKSNSQSGLRISIVLWNKKTNAYGWRDDEENQTAASWAGT